MLRGHRDSWSPFQILKSLWKKTLKWKCCSEFFFPARESTEWFIGNPLELKLAKENCCWERPCRLHYTVRHCQHNCLQQNEGNVTEQLDSLIPECWLVEEIILVSLTCTMCIRPKKWQGDFPVHWATEPWSSQAAYDKRCAEDGEQISPCLQDSVLQMETTGCELVSS